MLMGIRYDGLPQQGKLIVTLNEMAGDAELKVELYADGTRLKVNVLPHSFIEVGGSIEQYVINSMQRNNSQTTNLFAVVTHLITNNMNLGFAQDIFDLLDKPRAEFDRWLYTGEYARIPFLRAQAEEAYLAVRRQFRCRAPHIPHMWVKVELLENAVVFALHGADEQPPIYLLTLDPKGKVQLHGPQGILSERSNATQLMIDRVREYLTTQEMLGKLIRSTFPHCVIL